MPIRHVPQQVTETESLKRELDMKERMITKLINTVKEIFTVNIRVLNLDLFLLAKTKSKLIFQT